MPRSTLPLLVCLLALPLQAQSGKAGAPTVLATPATLEQVLSGLRFRELGPAVMGGRIDDVAVVESNPSIVYVATASGGVWKTQNAGTTWTPVFDREAVSSIGDVTVAPSDPSIVWVGTGEPNNRQSSSWGNGVYKSQDGGATWTCMGLQETHHIGRVLVHPTRPEVVYVAALGRLWGPSKERGVFKTVDGGRTWQQVLFISEDTGVVDLILDPQSPDTVLAAAYQRRRTVYGFNGSGPEGGIYKTIDGGASWKKVAKGLPWDPEPTSVRPATPFPSELAAQFGLTPPEPVAAPAAKPDSRQEVGRIGLAVYRRDPRILYALIEHEKGGLFRSEDKGETWVRMSETNPRPMYYSKVHVDPNNDQRLWVLGASMYTSDDGGRTFKSDLVQRIHGDFHALWINPANSDHMITGSDGGMHWSWDRGRTWEFVNNLAIGQFYEVGVDMAQPYRIYGGLQDNNTWGGPSRSLNPRGIANSDWFTVGAGDGFHVQVDPTDPTTVYAESQDGNLLRRNVVTGESRSIRPQPEEGEKPYRFQWNTPIAISQHDPKTLYYPGNFVFKSTDRGDSWSKISPDLTTGADRTILPIMGRIPDAKTRSRHDGVQQWPAITAFAESGSDRQVLWAGTDDGCLQVTRDGGRTWKNVFEKLPGVPKGTYVSRIVASKHAPGTAYATLDGHRSNDFKRYAYATADFGETWRLISQRMPETVGVLNVLREHPRNPDLLLAGGEHGLVVSLDRGASWVTLRLNLPTVPVDDIQIHPRENDLILGTHGRSIWVLDDLAPLVELNAGILQREVHLFTPRTAIQWRPWANSGFSGHKEFFGENPPLGALFQYFLKTKAAEPVHVEIRDEAGKLVRTLRGPAHAGVNRVVWDTRLEIPGMPAPGGEGGGPARGGGLFALGGGGPRVDPGTYQVKVLVAGQEAAGTVRVEDDPRLSIAPEVRAARWAVLNPMLSHLGALVTAQRTLPQLRTQVTAAIEAWKRPEARIPDTVKTAGEALLKKIDALYPNLGTLPTEERGLGDAGPALVERPAPLASRFLQAYGTLANQSDAPTDRQKAEVAQMLPKVQHLVATVRQLVQEDLAALNKRMNESGVPHLQLSMPERSGGRRAREE